MFRTHLPLGNPSPNIPFKPYMTPGLFVSEIAANACWGIESPATATTSRATGPLACVPVNESPYSRLTEPPAGCISAEGYTGMFVALHSVVLHASEITHKSLDPVSMYIMMSQMIALHATPADMTYRD